MKKTDPGVSPTVRAGTIVAALVGGALFSSAPAAADQFGVSIGIGAVGFSYNSGGYCDDYGCPTNYWDDPVYYCPVYYRHRWYRGPVYYSRRGGGTYFWIHHGWRRDEWGGPRPGWACNDRYGPPLDLYFYQSNGFRVRDAWWNSWGREHNDWYWRDHPDWNHNQNFGGRMSQGQEWDRARTWTSAGHPWAGARGQGPDQGGRSGGAMGVNPSQSPGGGVPSGDQGMHSRGAGGGGEDQGTQNRRAHGDNNPARPGPSNVQTGDHGNSQPSNMSGSGTTPQDKGVGQGADHGNRHRENPNDASGGGMGNSGNAGGGDSANGRGSDNPSGQGQGSARSDTSGDDKGTGKKHGDQNDNGNGKPQ